MMLAESLGIALFLLDRPKFRMSLHIHDGRFRAANTGAGDEKPPDLAP